MNKKKDELVFKFYLCFSSVCVGVLIDKVWVSEVESASSKFKKKWEFKSGNDVLDWREVGFAAGDI